MTCGRKLREQRSLRMKQHHAALRANPPYVTEVQRLEVLRLRALGTPYPKIRDAVGVGVATAYRIVKKKGRPPKGSHRVTFRFHALLHLYSLFHSALGRPRGSATFRTKRQRAAVANRLDRGGHARSVGLERGASKSTILRMARRTSTKYLSFIRSPPLTPSHKAARVSFAKHNKKRDWTKVCHVGMRVTHSSCLRGGIRHWRCLIGRHSSLALFDGENCRCFFPMNAASAWPIDDAAGGAKTE